jgi:hypothetical protein
MLSVMPNDQDASVKLVREILRDDYVRIEIERIEHIEDHVAGQSQTKVWLKPVASGQGSQELGLLIEGQGVGLVDAVFASLVTRFKVEYPSLGTINFVRFHVEGKFAGGSNRGGADGIGEVRLGVSNSAGREFEFTSASRSMTASTTRAVAACVEYFINSERAYVVTHRALKDAVERHREDLVQSYTARLVELVKNTSYVDVFKKS